MNPTISQDEIYKHIPPVIVKRKSIGGSGVQDKTDEQFNNELNAHFVMESEKLKTREIDLAERVKEARNYLDESVNTFRADWLDWIEESKTAINDMRTLRMALENERRLIKSALGDLKAAIEDNKGTVENVRALVGSIQQIQLLEQSGFLSKLTETCARLIK